MSFHTHSLEALETALSMEKVMCAVMVETRGRQLLVQRCVGLLPMRARPLDSTSPHASHAMPAACVRLCCSVVSYSKCTLPPFLRGGNMCSCVCLQALRCGRWLAAP